MYCYKGKQLFHNSVGDVGNEKTYIVKKFCIRKEAPVHLGETVSKNGK